jgi:hypothetical protein
LVSHFQRAAAALVGEFRKETKTKDLLRGWKQGRISKTGRLKRSKARYSFHGTGCRFELGGRTIEVEFGPSGRVDGFDAWRLEKYAASTFEWNGFAGERIQGGLQALEADGEIVRPGWEPTPEMYYLVGTAE